MVYSALRFFRVPQAFLKTSTEYVQLRTAASSTYRLNKVGTSLKVRLPTALSISKLSLSLAAGWKFTYPAERGHCHDVSKKGVFYFICQWNTIVKIYAFPPAHCLEHQTVHFTMLTSTF